MSIIRGKLHSEMVHQSKNLIMGIFRVTIFESICRIIYLFTSSVVLIAIERR